MSREAMLNVAYDKIIIMTGQYITAIKQIIGDIPPGSRELSSKEMLDNYMSLTTRDHAALLVQYGPVDYKRYIMEMENLRRKSDSAFLRSYGIGGV